MTDMKLQIADRIFYPDVMVTCSVADRARTQLKQDPTLLIDVLSPSTAAYDRGQKFRHYRSIESLQEYALIDVESRSCDVYRKGTAGLWVLYPFAAEEGIEFASFGVQIEAGQLFAEVD